MPANCVIDATKETQRAPNVLFSADAPVIYQRTKEHDAAQRGPQSITANRPSHPTPHPPAEAAVSRDGRMLAKDDQAEPGPRSPPPWGGAAGHRISPRRTWTSPPLPGPVRAPVGRGAAASSREAPWLACEGRSLHRTLKMMQGNVLVTGGGAPPPLPSAVI